MDLPNIALEFVIKCLEQRDARIATGPDGLPYRVIVSANSDLGNIERLDFYDLNEVLKAATDWCEGRGLELELICVPHFEGKACRCRISLREAEGLAWIAESGEPDHWYDDLASCGNACYAVLTACVEAGRNLEKRESQS